MQKLFPAENTRHTVLWSSVFVYFFSCIGAFINVLATPNPPLLLAIVSPVALLLGTAVLFMFLTACMAPFTSRDDMFLLQTLPDNFWKASYIIGMALVGVFITSIVFI